MAMPLSLTCVTQEGRISAIINTPAVMVDICWACVGALRHALCCEAAQVWYRILARDRTDCPPAVHLKPAVTLLQLLLVRGRGLKFPHYYLCSMLEPDGARA